MEERVGVWGSPGRGGRGWRTKGRRGGKEGALGENRGGGRGGSKLVGGVEGGDEGIIREGESAEAT